MNASYRGMSQYPEDYGGYGQSGNNMQPPPFHQGSFENANMGMMSSMSGTSGAAGYPMPGYESSQPHVMLSSQTGMPAPPTLYSSHSQSQAAYMAQQFYTNSAGTGAGSGSPFSAHAGSAGGSGGQFSGQGYPVQGSSPYYSSSGQGQGGGGTRMAPPPHHHLRNTSGHQNPQMVADNILQMASAYPSHHTVQVPLKNRHAPYQISRSPQHYYPDKGSSQQPTMGGLGSQPTMGGPTLHNPQALLGQQTLTNTSQSQAQMGPGTGVCQSPGQMGPGAGVCQSPGQMGGAGMCQSPAMMYAGSSPHSQMQTSPASPAMMPSGAPPSHSLSSPSALHSPSSASVCSPVPSSPGMLNMRSPTSMPMPSPAHMSSTYMSSPPHRPVDSAQHCSPPAIPSPASHTSSPYTPAGVASMVSSPPHLHSYPPSSSQPTHKMNMLMDSGQGPGRVPGTQGVGSNPLQSLQKLVMLPESRVVDPKSVVSEEGLQHTDHASKNSEGPAEQSREAEGCSAGVFVNTSPPTIANHANMTSPMSSPNTCSHPNSITTSPPRTCIPVNTDTATPVHTSPRIFNTSPPSTTPVHTSPRMFTTSPPSTTPVHTSPRMFNTNPPSSTPVHTSPRMFNTSPPSTTPVHTSPRMFNTSPPSTTPVHTSPRVFNTSPPSPVDTSPASPVNPVISPSAVDTCSTPSSPEKTCSPPKPVNPPPSPVTCPKPVNPPPSPVTSPSAVGTCSKPVNPPPSPEKTCSPASPLPLCNPSTEVSQPQHMRGDCVTTAEEDVGPSCGSQNNPPTPASLLAHSSGPAVRQDVCAPPTDPKPSISDIDESASLCTSSLIQAPLQVDSQHGSVGCESPASHCHKGLSVSLRDQQCDKSQCCEDSLVQSQDVKVKEQVSLPSLTNGPLSPVQASDHIKQETETNFPSELKTPGASVELAEEKHQIADKKEVIVSNNVSEKEDERLAVNPSPVKKRQSRRLRSLTDKSVTISSSLLAESKVDKSVWDKEMSVGQSAVHTSRADKPSTQMSVGQSAVRTSRTDNPSIPKTRQSRRLCQTSAESDRDTSVGLTDTIKTSDSVGRVEAAPNTVGKMKLVNGFDTHLASGQSQIAATKGKLPPRTHGGKKGALKKWTDSEHQQEASAAGRGRGRRKSGVESTSCKAASDPDTTLVTSARGSDAEKEETTSRLHPSQGTTEAEPEIEAEPSGQTVKPGIAGDVEMAGKRRGQTVKPGIAGDVEMAGKRRGQTVKPGIAGDVEMAGKRKGQTVKPGIAVDGESEARQGRDQSVKSGCVDRGREAPMDCGQVSDAPSELADQDVVAGIDISWISRPVASDEDSLSLELDFGYDSPPCDLQDDGWKPDLNKRLATNGVDEADGGDSATPPNPPVAQRTNPHKPTPQMVTRTVTRSITGRVPKRRYDESDFMFGLKRTRRSLAVTDPASTMSLSMECEDVDSKDSVSDVEVISSSDEFSTRGTRVTKPSPVVLSKPGSHNHKLARKAQGNCGTSPAEDSARCSYEGVKGGGGRLVSSRPCTATPLSSSTSFGQHSWSHITQPHTKDTTNSVCAVTEPKVTRRTSKQSVNERGHGGSVCREQSPPCVSSKRHVGKGSKPLPVTNIVRDCVSTHNRSDLLPGSLPSNSTRISSHPKPGPSSLTTHASRSPHGPSGSAPHKYSATTTPTTTVGPASHLSHRTAGLSSAAPKSCVTGLHASSSRPGSSKLADTQHALVSRVSENHVTVSHTGSSVCQGGVVPVNIKSALSASLSSKDFIGHSSSSSDKMCFVKKEVRTPSKKKIKKHTKGKHKNPFMEMDSVDDSFKTMKFSRTLHHMQHNKKDKSQSSGHFAPFVRVQGKQSSPCAVSVFNAPPVTTKDSKCSNKNKSAVTSGAATATVQITNFSSDKSVMMPWAKTTEAPWVCALCGKRSSFRFLGDLFGPYFLESHVALLSKGEGGKKDGRADCASDWQTSPSTRRKCGSQGRSMSTEEVTLPREVWVHEDCVMWSSGVCAVGSRLYGLEEALRHTDNTVCACCKEKGALIGCLHKGCTQNYHYICAVDEMCYLDGENFSMLCPKHKDKKLKAVATPTKS